MNKRLLDGGEYIPAANTDIKATWRKFGFKPTTAAERLARQKKDETPANVTQMRKKRA